MQVSPPPPFVESAVRRALHDLRVERAAPFPLPPGETRFSVARTRRFIKDPLELLLEMYERYGPVFTLRIVHMAGVWMIGPEANHYVTVSNAGNFGWRDGVMGELTQFLGDGLLTIDGSYHKRARRIMLPAFHHERVAATADTMLDETERALFSWQPGERIDVYAVTRRLALRIAMRALFGLDPDRATRGVDVAKEFETALHYWEYYYLHFLRGPGSPYARMKRAKRLIDSVVFPEIERRRRLPEGERGQDVLSLLLDARDEDGSALSDQEVRDQVMTLMFAGHDTTTSTVSFLLYELARDPVALEKLVEEQERVLAGRRPTPAELAGGLPQLEMAVNETLRLYPAAWMGPRVAFESFEFAGQRVPAGMPVVYSSLVSHHLPDVFPEPKAFRPERFVPENRAKLPKGAYVPFGGGSRICIGMRFGLLEVKAIATTLLQRFQIGLEPGYHMELRRMPTLSPRRGVPLCLKSRRLG
jgi:cytochrome P450